LNYGSADPNIKDNYGNTALHVACLNKNSKIEVIKLLIEKGAVLDEKNTPGHTALHLACWSFNKNSNIEVIKLLIDKCTALDQKDKDGDTALHCACLSKNPSIEVIKLLIEKGAVLDEKNKYGDNALHCACLSQNPNIEVIKLLIDKGTAALNQKNDKGNTALHCACLNENPSLEVIELLLQKGLDPNISDKNGSTSLHCACIDPININIIKLLLLYGVDLKIVIEDNRRLIHYLCHENETEAVEKLLEWETAISSVKSHLEQNSKALLFLCCLKSLEAAQQYRIDTNLKKRILIESAVIGLPGCEQMKEIFLSDKPCDQMCTKIQDELILFKDSNGRTAIEIADEKLQDDIVGKMMQFCLKNGLKKEDRQHLFEYFMEKNNKYCVELLLKDGSIDANKKAHEEAKSLVCKAVDNGWVDVVVELVKGGAEDCTIWHYAYTKNNFASRM
jgi:ankyrin repeat protein